jgi:hypothetical protein
VNVPLQFDFPYYGQTFNNSWLFSNGIISFQDPNASGLAWQNLSVQPMSSTMGSQFNYSIFPLWTDLINISGTFKTDGSTESQKYSWIGISPFYEGNRFNTFFVEIKPDGSIKSNYSLIDVNYGQVGLTGNTSLGQFEHIASLGRTNTLDSWDRITSAPPPPEDPCITNPLSSSSCPGYAQALLASLPTLPVAPTTVESAPVVTSEPVQDSTPVAQQSIQQTPQQSTSSTGEVTPTQSVTAATTPSANEQQSTGRPRVALSTILSILGAEQSRLSNVERSTIEASVEQSARESDRSTQQAEALASGAVSESILVGAASSQQASELLSSAISQSDDQNKSATSVSGFSAVSVLNSESTTIGNSGKLEEKTETVKQNVPNNTLAGNVTIASLGTQPVGFQAYLSVIPDSAFYAPREIYRNQTPVDNRRLLRQLGGASDRLHQMMIDAQYK